MSANYRVLTLGDSLITMNPSSTGPLRFVTNFSRRVGGAELNFAIGCARLGLQAKWISRLGNDEFGRVIYNFARGEGIDVTDVELVDGFPTSLNFKEIQADGSGKTFYYRHQSPMSTLEPEDVTEAMFTDVDLVHLTGVFLSIDSRHSQIVKRVLEIAQSLNIPVSFDPNLRLKMWTIEEARATIIDIFPYVDILLTGRDEIELLIGDSSAQALEACAEKYNISQFVVKDGAKGSKLLTAGKWIEREAFKVQAVDTVGAGDGFDAGYIFAYLTGESPEERLKLANGVGALVTTVVGDNEGLPYAKDLIAFVHDKKIIER